MCIWSAKRLSALICNGETGGERESEEAGETFRPHATSHNAFYKLFHVPFTIIMVIGAQ